MGEGGQRLAVIRAGRLPQPGPRAVEERLRHALLDDAAINADVTGGTSQLLVQTLDGTSPAGATPPLVLETLDGGNAFPGHSSVHVDDQDQVQVGFSYVHYYFPPDGGALQTTRGLRYARYCP